MFGRLTFQAPALLAGAFLLTSVTWADGKMELAGYGGGISIDQGGGTHAIIGGSVGAAIVDKLRVFGEFNYAPLGSASFAGDVEGVSVLAHVSQKLYNFGGGVEYGFGSSTRAVPYVLGAIGIGHSALTGTGTGSMGSVRASADISESSNALYFGGGGGIRLYAGQHWGIKPEFRYQRYQQSEGGGNTFVYTVGLFFQFGK